MADSIWDDGTQLTGGPLNGTMFHGEHCGSCVEFDYGMSAADGSYQLH